MALSRIVATVTTVRPVASVQVQGANTVNTTSISAGVSVQRVVPLAAINWISIVMGAEVDYRGLNPVIHEINVVADTSRLLVGKRFFDSSATSDSYTLLVFKKATAETLHPVDVKTFSLQRQISESLHSQDDFNASVPTDDGEVMTFGKHVPDDAVTKSDIEHMAFGKLSNESVASVDVRSHSLSKPLSDANSVSDVVANQIDKPLSDTVDAGDEMNAQAITDDGEIMVFGKTTSDYHEVADEAIVEAGKNLSDSIGSSDELLPFELGKGISDNTNTSEIRSVDLVRGAIEDVVTPFELCQFSLPKAVKDYAYQAEGPNQYDTYAIAYFLEDYVREGFPALQFSKLLNDTVISTDDFYGAANADDDETMQFAKVLIESATMADSLTNFTSKPLSDSASTSDAVSRLSGKSLTDTFSKSDASSKEFWKSISDLFASSDSKVFAVGKGLTDTTQTSETNEFAFSKRLTDTVIATDDFYGVANADDDETMLFNKATSDTFTKSDSTAVTAGKGLTDSVSKSDSGSLVWTDYWDINYTVTTSGVYVGNSQTF